MKSSETQRDRVRFLIDLAYWTAILALVAGALKFIRVVLPLLLALVLAAAVRPVSHFLSRETRYVRNRRGERVLVARKFHLHRTLAGVLSVLVLIGLLGAAAVLLISRAADTAAKLVSVLPEFYETRLSPGVNELYRRLIDGSERFDPSVAEALRTSLPELFSSLGSSVTMASGRMVGWLTSLAARLPSILFTILITMIAAVFIAVDYDRIKGFIRRNVPSRPLHYLMTVRNSFVDMIGRLVRSYLLLLVITVSENILGLWLIGIRQPVLPGLLIGVVDIFPVVGSGTVLLPWAAVCLLTGDTLRAGLLALLYLCITVVRQILEPRLVGERVGLRPIVTLGCMVVGGRLFGAVGLLSLPIMTAILADLDRGGVIQLFHRPQEPEEPEQTIHTEGIEA